jgi:Family of unknown function (DUF6459)
MTPPPPTSASKPRPRVRGPGDHAVLPLVPGFERTPTRTRPLPDAEAVRLVVVPDSAPPYDDGRAVMPAGHCAPPEPPRARERPGMPSPGAPAPDEDHGRGGQAAAAGWPSQFAQVLAETLAGSRPQGQITPWTTQQARRLIRQLRPTLAAGPVPRVRRVLASRPAEGVVEMTVVVGCGPRIRALAVRLEQDGPRHAGSGRAASAAGWVCTAIEAA